MLNNFNDLFNEFFNRKRITPNIINDEINKIIQSLSNFNQTEDQLSFEQSILNNLGEPDEIIDHIEDDLHFKKLVWNTKQGQFVKIIVDDAHKHKPNKSIEERLNEAVEAEDYPLAIKLRDEIKAIKNASKKTPTKKTRKKTKE